MEGASVSEFHDADTQIWFPDDNEFDPETDDIMTQMLDPVCQVDEKDKVESLADIKQEGQRVKKIRVVVARVYPKLYYILDSNGEKVIVEQRRFDKIMSKDKSGRSDNAGPSGLSSVKTIPEWLLQHCVMVRGVDVASFNMNDMTRSVKINIRKPASMNLPEFVKGEVVEFRNLEVSQDLGYEERLLISTNGTTTSSLGNDGVVMENLGRMLYSFSSIKTLDFKPPYNEVDIVGVICEIDARPAVMGNHVQILGLDGETLWIDFQHTVKWYQLDDVIAVGKVIGFKNLCFYRNPLFLANRTNVYPYPNFGIFKNTVEGLQKVYARYIETHKKE